MPGRSAATSKHFPPPGVPLPSGGRHPLLDLFLFLVFLYLFLFSIELMSAAFKLAGKGFAEHLLTMTSDPVAGLIIGIVVTSIIQSSSTTTSIVVGLVAAGSLDLRLAIPVIMGANIGTTVTNTIVSLGHVRNPKEMERAFAAATVHDFFNIMSVLVLFPMELRFHLIEKTATALERAFEGAGGVAMVSPLKLILGPPVHHLKDLLPHPVPLLVLAFLVLFLSLSRMVRLMRRHVMGRAEGFFSRGLFRNDAIAYLVGWILTSLVQSSSVTTSLVVPLAGTGALSVREIYPYTLGANLGTTITALLASLATANPAAVTVALSHLVFNMFGTAVFYPLRILPIRLSTGLGAIAARSRRNLVYVFVIYALLHVIPIVYVLFR
ncbi:MAG: Na/Pi symporter [Candidatus Eisenbacteria bacterium]